MRKTANLGSESDHHQRNSQEPTSSGGPRFSSHNLFTFIMGTYISQAFLFPPNCVFRLVIRFCFSFS